MFSHIQSFVIVLKVFGFSIFFIWIGSILKRQYVFSRDAGTGQTSLNFPNPWSRGYLLKMLKTLLLTICLDWPELLSVVPCTCRFWRFYFCWHSQILVTYYICDLYHSHGCRKGPSINYIISKLAIFDPPSLSSFY